jgi:4-amino-4-deoxy-L-arabinose transferase-like glycosyltransferase
LGPIGVGAFAASLVLGRWLFPLGSVNHDEPMYVFQARLLSHGRLSLPARFAPFRPWASGVRGGRLVLKYTPVWPSMLAVGARLGAMRLGPAAAASAAVVLIGWLGRELFGRWREGVLAAVVLACSPLFLLQSGTYLPYVFELALEIAIVWLVLGALRRSDRVDYARRAVATRLVAAGALWGVALFARQYDAVLLAVPLVAGTIAATWPRPFCLARCVGWVAAGAFVPLAAFYAYNTVLMGSPLRSTFSVTGSSDALGFGKRGVFLASSFTYTIGDARISVERTLAQFPAWCFGGLLLVAIAAFGLWRSRHRGYAVWTIAAIAVSFVIGYAMFWSPYSIVKLWPGAHILGPFYHLALLIPLSVFAAVGLGAFFDRARAIGVVALAALAVITAVNIVPRINRNRTVTDQYQAIQQIVRAAKLEHAVLFVDDRGQNGYESTAPFLENTPALNQSLIYAIEGGPNDLTVLAQHPGRNGARFRSELRPGDQLLHPSHFVEPLHIKQGTTVPLSFHITNTIGAPTVTITLKLNGRTRTVVLDRHSHRDKTYDLSWTLTTNPTPSPTTTTITVPANSNGEAIAEVEFTNVDQPTQEYQRLYPYAANTTQITLLTPGIGQYLFTYRTPIWLNQDINPTLSENTQPQYHR